jgi:hypothetical protein
VPNYNVEPGDFQPVIRRSRDTRERELVMMRRRIQEALHDPR